MKTVKLLLSSGHFVLEVAHDQAAAFARRDSFMTTVQAIWEQDAFSRSTTLLDFGNAKVRADSVSGAEVVRD